MRELGADPDLADPHLGDSDPAPEERVHHHAHEEQVTVGAIVTLCGLTLDGPRPQARSMPCCPMCGAEMEALGQRCRNG